MCLFLNNDIEADDVVRQLINCDHILPVFKSYTIRGKLNLRHKIVHTPIEFYNCTFVDEVDLRYIESFQLVSFKKCIFKKELNSGDKIESHSHYHKDLIFINCIFENSAFFNGVICGGTGYFHNSIFKDKVDFGHAYFKVHLECNNTHFKKDANFNSIRADDCILKEAVFEGSVMFTMARFGGSLILNESKFLRKDQALLFNNLKCYNFCFIKSSITTNHEIRFDNLDCDHFIFGLDNVNKNKYKYEINSKSISFRNCHCRNFKITSSRLQSTNEKIDFSNSVFTLVDFSRSYFFSEVSFENINIKDRIELDNSHFQELVSFCNSNIVKIIISKNGNFPFTKNSLNLRGLNFLILEDRKKYWKDFVEAQQTDKFSRDPYIQIEKYFHKLGDEVRSADVYYEGREQLRQTALNNSVEDIQWNKKRKLWNLFLKHLTGYGVQTERLFYFIMIFVIIGALVFWNDNTLKYTDNKSTIEASNYVKVSEIASASVRDRNPTKKAFQKFSYSLDLFVPVLDLQIASKLELPSSAPILIQIYKIVHIFAGWILIPLLIASFSGIIRKNN